MTKTEALAEAALAAAEPEAPPAQPNAEPAAGTPLTAMESLSAAGREPLRIWKTGGPKGVGGEIAAVLCQDDNTICLVHTLASGRFSVFAKVAN